MSKPYSRVIQAGTIVGTLDILSAFTYYYIKTGKMQFFNVLKFIASGIFGKDASSGGNTMILTGLFLHYFIAFAFTIFFFWIFPFLKSFLKKNILIAVVYGIFTWMVMNLIMVPLSNVAHRPFSIANTTINVIILIICIGLPLSYMASSHYHKVGKA